MTVYRTSTVKRHRRTKVEVETLCDAIIEILDQDNPQSVRHVFYCLTGHPYSLVPKTVAGYRTVQNKLMDLRREGRVPWGWVSDGTRVRRHGVSFDTPAEAVRAIARNYRRDLWRRTPVYVEVWCESDSMAGVLIEETNRYNVPLMTSRGFSSASYLYRAALEIGEQDRPAYLYYVGDWDPSGKMIPEVIERELRQFAPRAEIHFERLLVTPDQIKEWSLPTAPAKATTHARNFAGGTVEAEAVPAHITRQIVRKAIEQHLDRREVAIMTEAERSERSLLFSMAHNLEAKP